MIESTTATIQGGHVDIGKRLRDLREQKQLSQGDIEKRTGLFRCYTSRVEHGHTIPTIETLEKMARALEVPMYQLFIGAEEKQSAIFRMLRKTSKGKSFGSDRKNERHLIQLSRFLANMSEPNRKLLLNLVSAMARRKK